MQLCLCMSSYRINLHPIIVLSGWQAVAFLQVNQYILVMYFIYLH